MAFVHLEYTALAALCVKSGFKFSPCPEEPAALNALIGHLREDVKKVDDPQFKARFETSAEVLGGLVKAFSDYEAKNEAAWKKEN